jgi:hypothetical protein
MDRYCRFWFVYGIGERSETKYTINNSPLPSNVINDIDINSVQLAKFFATAKGMISFKALQQQQSEDLRMLMFIQTQCA